MATGDLAALLKTAIGLDASSIGLPALEQAIAERRGACALADASAYLDLVLRSPEELQALVDAVTVPETWFFRDREAFNLLSDVCLRRTMRNGAGPIRLLSLPCSTGEEPYSMAMALADAGLPLQAFEVNGVDVSRRALTRAERATYGRNSFRGLDRGLRQRHFDAIDGQHRVRDLVRRAVTFRQANIFDEHFAANAGLYDVIFCRNLLIYFDRATQDRAVRILDAMLGPLGVLFVAPSETALLIDHGFRSFRWPAAYAFERADNRKRQSDGVPAARKVGRPVPARNQSPPGQSAREPHRSPASATPDAAPDLDDAQRLADSGQLDAAKMHCESHVRQYGPSAQAFYLLGLLRDASGSVHEAAELYRKALYLDPNHYESLVHFALVMDRMGNAPRARAIRRRASELAAKGHGDVRS